MGSPDGVAQPFRQRFGLVGTGERLPALTPELLRHFEDDAAALRVLVPQRDGWTISSSRSGAEG